MQTPLRPGPTLLLPLLLALTPPGVSIAQVVLQTRPEGYGDILKRGTALENHLGGIVWNGTEWVMTVDWVHRYAIDARTGARMKEFAVAQRFTGAAPVGVLGTFAGYRVTRTLSSLAKRAAAGNGTYRWRGVDYEVVDTASGRTHVLRSRGVGAGVAAAYFDVFLEDETVSGSAQTTALVGDPAWFTIPMKPAAAAQLADLSPYRTGDLPGALTALGTKAGDYYWDVANGADLGPAGVGRSYELLCSPLGSRVDDLSGSYVTRFNLKWMDATGNLKMLQLEPALDSETWEPDAGVPTPLLVPVVLSLAGAQGSYFTTELSLTNRSGVDARLSLAYTATLGGGSGSVPLTLPAGRQMTIPDAIAHLRALGLSIPDSGSRLGTLRVDVLGPPPDQVAVTSRTTTLVPEGRAGLAYPALATTGLLTGPALVHGLRGGASDRSNLALVNAGSVEARYSVTVTSGDPAAPGSGSFQTDPLPSGGFVQLSLDDLLSRAGLAGTSPNVWVRVDPATPGPYVTYGVVNDQGNSDGSFLSSVPEASAAGRAGLVLPVAVETASATPFTTELVLTNTTTSPRSVTLAFQTTLGTSPGARSIDTWTLQPGEQRIVHELVDFLRSRGIAGIGPRGTTFAGAVFLTAAAGSLDGVLAGARTSAPGSVTGRYGLFYPAVPSRDAATTAAWLFGLRQDAENRTNLAMVNAASSGDPIRLRVDLFRADDGQLIASPEGSDITLAPGAWTQVDRVLERLAPGVASAYARVSRVAGVSPFVVYAVVNDGAVAGERSGDGAYVPMAVE